MDEQQLPAESATIEPTVKRTTNGPKGIHPAIRKVWLFSAFISVLMIGAMMLAVVIPLVISMRRHPERVFWSTLGIALLILIWVGIVIYTMAKIKAQWKNWTYEVRENDVVLSWGVLWQTRRHVARDRIQHLDINSGPLDRRFGLVQVGVFTAGALGTVGVIPGLTNAEAEDLRDMILESQVEHV
jgi:membrane protein YdbS with pleckstrin-like domain